MKKRTPIRIKKSFCSMVLNKIESRAFQIINEGSGNFMGSSPTRELKLYGETRISLTVIHTFYECMESPGGLSAEFFEELLETESFGLTKAQDLNNAATRLARSVNRWIKKFRSDNSIE